MLVLPDFLWCIAIYAMKLCMENSIVALQEIVAHQSEDIERLSAELYIQQEEVAALRKHVTQLQVYYKTAVEEISSMRGGEQDVPPPHY
jgi:uncharacterized coiled-coil protein SlyX